MWLLPLFENWDKGAYLQSLGTSSLSLFLQDYSLQFPGPTCLGGHSSRREDLNSFIGALFLSLHPSWASVRSYLSLFALPRLKIGVFGRKDRSTKLKNSALSLLSISMMSSAPNSHPFFPSSCTKLEGEDYGGVEENQFNFHQSQ